MIVKPVSSLTMLCRRMHLLASPRRRRRMPIDVNEFGFRFRAVVGGFDGHVHWTDITAMVAVRVPTPIISDIVQIGLVFGNRCFMCDELHTEFNELVDAARRHLNIYKPLYDFTTSSAESALLYGSQHGGRLTYAA